MTELKPGCILFDTKFVFRDNEIGEKLIVLLNNPRKKRAIFIQSNHLNRKTSLSNKNSIWMSKEFTIFFYKCM